MEQTVQIEGLVEVRADEFIGGFDGESEEWVRAFLAAAPGAVRVSEELAGIDPVRACVYFADGTEAMLAARAQKRAEEKAERAKEHRQAVADARQRVREIGAFVGSSGALYDVTDVDCIDTATLTKRDDAEGHYLLVKVLALVEPGFLAEEHGLVAAPEAQRSAIVTKLKVAAALDIPADEITLVWDGGDECDRPQADKILDIEIRHGLMALRPTRATWEKLVAAGLPIYPYDAAAVSWGAQ